MSRSIAYRARRRVARHRRRAERRALLAEVARTFPGGLGEMWGLPRWLRAYTLHSYEIILRRAACPIVPGAERRQGGRR